MAGPSNPTRPLGTCSDPPRLVAIVASAGGIEALFELLGGLRSEFQIPIIVAQHLARDRSSNLTTLVTWRTGRTAQWVREGDFPNAGQVYIVPPGQVAAITPTGFTIRHLSSSPTAWLPSPDILLSSIARHYGSRAVGVILSGMIGVGVDGLRAIRAAGGLVMAQTTKSAAHDDMPAAAIDFGKADIVMTPKGLARALSALTDLSDLEAI